MRQKIILIAGLVFLSLSSTIAFSEQLEISTDTKIDYINPYPNTSYFDLGTFTLSDVI